MPRLSPVPRPQAPTAGYPPCPIDPDYDRYYVLDDAGSPIRVYDYTEHSLWFCCEGKGWQIKDRLLEHAVDVWTYFSGWASMRTDDPPTFRTTLSGCINKCFESVSWDEAVDKHQRVIKKVLRELPKVEAP